MGLTRFQKASTAMQVSEVMTHNVQCVPPEASLKSVAELMRSLGCGALPVCANDRLIGMITDRDIVTRVVARGMDVNETEAIAAMTRRIVYCFADQEVSEAVSLMEERQIRRLAVLNRSKRLAGIVSAGDIATRAASERLSGELLEKVSEPDLQIA